MSKAFSTRKRKQDQMSQDSGLVALENIQNKTKKATLSSKVSKLKSQASSESVSVANKTQEDEYFWLMKSEPESRIENGHEMKFGLDDLKESKDQTTHWDGVSEIK